MLRRLVFSLSATGLALYGLSAAADPPVPAAAPAATSTAVKTRDYYPTAGWRTRELAAAGIDGGRFDELLAYLFPPPRSAEEERARRGQRTDAFVLIKDGHLVFERYVRGYRAESRHYGWSMSKSVVNALIGIAEKEGKLKRDALVTELAPGLAGKAQLAGLTLEHLLHMSSGLAWAETYEYSPLKSTVISMLYTAGFRDMGSYVAGRPREFAVGQHYRYSSGDTNLICMILKSRMSQAEYDDYPFSRLFTPLGMSSAVFEQDAGGTFVGSSYVHASARDFAKFGFLYLNGGVWEGRALLPADWVAYSTRMSPAYYTSQLAPDEREENPGAQFWLNLGDARRGLQKPWPDATAGTFAALGHWGQSIFIIPEHDLVAVRLADDRDGSFDQNRYLGLLLRSLKKEVRP